MHVIKVRQEYLKIDKLRSPRFWSMKLKYRLSQKEIVDLLKAGENIRFAISRTKKNNMPAISQENFKNIVYKLMNKAGRNE